MEEKEIELLLGTLFNLSIYAFVFVHSPGLNQLTSSLVFERDLILAQI